MRMGIKIFTIFFALAMVAVPAVAGANSSPYQRLSTSYQKIFYYKENGTSRASLFKNWKYIDVLAPQAYAINSEGKLEGSIGSLTLNFARTHGIKMMPLVTNKAFGKEAFQAVLDDSVKQSSAIAALASEAKAKGYWGWQIDFEGMDSSYRDKFSAFVKNFSDAMRENGLKSSVATVAEVSENPNDYPRNLWQRLIGVYDYKSLGQSADFVSIMSYDDPNSSGPISGYPWLSKVLDYSRSVIPAEKISLGIPLYYWRWNTASDKLMAAGGFSQLKNFIKKYKVYFGYSSSEQESYISYWSGGTKYMIWYEDTEGMAAKIALIKKFKLAGFSAWVLGLEVPGVYKAIK